MRTSQTIVIDLVVMCSILIFSGCMNSSKKHYEYADGNANRYVLTPDSLQYIPVLAQESSSGMYSGGQPKVVTISIDDFEVLESHLKNLVKRVELHSTNRMKMSGLIKDKDSQKAVIIKPCPELTALDSLLQVTLNQH